MDIKSEASGQKHFIVEDRLQYWQMRSKSFRLQKSTEETMNKNELASFQTRNRILEIARQKFVTKGFYNTSLEEIVEEIGLTRGAFYHHFKNKEGILSDLILIIQSEVADYVEKKAMEGKDSWEQLILGCVAFVEKALDKDILKILLIDGPSVITGRSACLP